MKLNKGSIRALIGAWVIGLHKRTAVGIETGGGPFDAKEAILQKEGHEGCIRSPSQ